MTRSCNLCHRTFDTERRYDSHNINIHKFPKPPAPPSTFIRHPSLTALPCDEDGDFLPPGTPPPPRDDSHDWWPFEDRPQFEFAHWHFEEVKTSRRKINQLLRILAAQKAAETGNPNASMFFKDADDIEEHIDAIPYGEIPWRAFEMRYTGPITPHTPAWKLQTYTVYTRDPLRVAESMASSADFHRTWDYSPFEEYIGQNCRRFSHFMSGHWAFKKANKLSEDPAMHGAMLVPVIFGADKTTVSVVAGHQAFHPLYMSLGNIHNEMRRAHRDAVIPLAFLAIPKRGRDKDSNEFRLFSKELYHRALAQILSPLRPAMIAPHIMRCPDGHFRRAIFELGPFIADYPEQVCLAGIVQGWCPKCLAFPDNLENPGKPRFREHTECLVETFTPRVLWDVFGVVADVQPFTNHFPRADIHELITPDLLHQLIKGTFKEHLVEWVMEYIRLTAESEDAANRIIEEIDRRIAAAPPFPGLRHFHHGRNFSQWTGQDSKCLMKVYISAITGLVPPKMVQCLTVFLDFCYDARRSSHDTFSLDAMQEALDFFHELSIRLFGSLNGLCSSITESKHIVAVKETWRRSNRRGPIGQMLQTIARQSQMSTALIEFGRRGMLQNDVLTAARIELGDDNTEDLQQQKEDVFLGALLDAQDNDGDRDKTRRLNSLADELHEPNLREMIARFVHVLRYPGVDLPPDATLDDMPHIPARERISLHPSASVVYYAPSDICGPAGMHPASPYWLFEHLHVFGHLYFKISPMHFGCNTLETPHHLFVECPHFAAMREESGAAVTRETSSLLDAAETPLPRDVILRTARALFIDDPRIWPQSSSRYFLGMVPAIPRLPSETGAHLPSTRLLARVAALWHSTSIRLTARIWGSYKRATYPFPVRITPTLSLPPHLAHLL
ncbi:transcription factor [Ganoderma sinense ZZ0214-1]|uniref:Transcription factor n=1 Tax=Ganoderma sinense ZZ0214-1 TaxID=1077348 RepID=A0A2G8SVH1_9APHY|nr:transcription factor [Ganoderma sinense ZZ0214-1]